MISDRLRRVITNELGVKTLEVREGTTAHDIPGWDSLTHVRIIFAIEREFSIRFSNREITALATIRDLQQLVDEKAGPGPLPPP